MEYLVICTAEIAMSTRLMKRIKEELSAKDNILSRMIVESGKSKPVIEVAGNRLKIRTTTETRKPEEIIESELDNLWKHVLRIWKLDLNSRKVVSRIKDVSVQVSKVSD